MGCTTGANIMMNTYLKGFESNDKLLLLIPIFGWLFIVYGLIFPIDNIYIKWMWYIDIFLSIPVHLLQLIIAVPVGTKSGYSKTQSTLLTIAFGATWWKPVREMLNNKELSNKELGEK
jgi:ABC-type dipeptide/oligopeptide/nickel transport system permease subunit